MKRAKKAKNQLAAIRQMSLGRPYELRRLGFDNYRQYLASDLWKTIRRRVLERDGNLCATCGKEARHVHRRSYEYAALSGDSIDNLVSLCGGCHFSIELRSGRKIRPGKSWRTAKRPALASWTRKRVVEAIDRAVVGEVTRMVDDPKT